LLRPAQNLKAPFFFLSVDLLEYDKYSTHGHHLSPVSGPRRLSLRRSSPLLLKSKAMVILKSRRQEQKKGRLLSAAAMSQGSPSPRDGGLSCHIVWQFR